MRARAKKASKPPLPKEQVKVVLFNKPFDVLSHFTDAEKRQAWRILFQLNMCMPLVV